MLAAMLATSIWIIAAELYGAGEGSIAIADELPVNHQNLVSFSSVQNVLIIMLDGFSGGYVQNKEQLPGHS